MTSSSELLDYVNYYINRKMKNSLSASLSPSLSSPPSSFLEIPKDERMEQVIDLYERVYDTNTKTAQSFIEDEQYIDNVGNCKGEEQENYNSVGSSCSSTNGLHVKNMKIHQHKYDQEVEPVGVDEANSDTDKDEKENNDNTDYDIVGTTLNIGKGDKKHSSLSSMYRSTQLCANELRRCLYGLCDREVVDEVMRLRRCYFLNFDPYIWVSNLVSAYPSSLYRIAESNARTKPVDFVRYLRLGNLIQLLALCSHSQSQLCRLHNDASFMHALFAYVASGNYRSEEAQRAHSFYRHFAEYVAGFDGSEYNGYERSIGDHRPPVLALYMHPHNRFLFFCPTLYKMLRYLRQQMATVNTTTVLDRVPLPSALYNRGGDSENYECLMRRVALAFITECWDAETLALLSCSTAGGAGIKTKEMEEMGQRIEQTRPKYITGTACCGKTTMLSLLHDRWGWCTASRGDLGSFGGKSLSPAYVAALHASLDYALRTYSAGMIGDRGPLDNYLWTFVMPALGKVALLLDEYGVGVSSSLDQRISTLLVSMFLEFISVTQNNLTLGYHRDYHVLVTVDPYSSRVHKRMLARCEGNDAHRALIPYYAHTQNIAYWCAALIYGYPVLVMPYTDSGNGYGIASLRENYNELNRCQSKLAATLYGQADSNVAEMAKKTIDETVRTTKDNVPTFLLDTTYQRAMGIHK